MFKTTFRTLAGQLYSNKNRFFKLIVSLQVQFYSVERSTSFKDETSWRNVHVFELFVVIMHVFCYYCYLCKVVFYSVRLWTTILAIISQDHQLIFLSSKAKIVNLLLFSLNCSVVLDGWRFFSEVEVCAQLCWVCQEMNDTRRWQSLFSFRPLSNPLFSPQLHICSCRWSDVLVGRTVWFFLM